MIADGTDESHGSANSSDSLGAVVLALRFAAFVLTPIGFLGLATEDAWLEPMASIYGPVFAGGVVAAVVSIYLALYQHDIDN